MKAYKLTGYGETFFALELNSDSRQKICIQDGKTISIFFEYPFLYKKTEVPLKEFFDAYKDAKERVENLLLKELSLLDIDE